MANQLLSDPNGQESLKAVYRFITYNSDWVQRALGVTPVIGGTSNAGSFVHKADEDETKPQLAPWEEKTFKEATPAEICSKIGNFCAVVSSGAHCSRCAHAARRRQFELHASELELRVYEVELLATKH